MKNEDKQFDDFLRARFGQQKFEQKDRYWMNAQEMIAAQRKGRSKVILAFVLSAVTLVSVSIGLLWNTAVSPVQSVSAENTIGSHSDSNHNTDGYADISNVSASAEISNGSSANINEKALNNNRTAGHSTHATATSADSHAENGVAMFTSYTSENSPVASSTAKAERNKTGRNRKAGTAKKQHIAHQTLQDQHDEDAPAKPYDEASSYTMAGRFFRSFGPSKSTIDSFSKKEAFLTYSVREQRSFLTAEAGINCYNLNKDGLSSLNFQAGLRYYHFVAPRIGLSTGISYSRIHQNLNTRTYRDIDYSFGQNAVETKITTLRLDYIELPLAVHYRINGNHFATAGTTLNYAISSSEFVEQGVNNGKKDNGYMEAINKFDMQLHVGYNCFLNDRFTLSAGYYFGLMDVSNNTSFKSDKFDRNAGMRFSLGYKLF